MKTLIIITSLILSLSSNKAMNMNYTPYSTNIETPATRTVSAELTDSDSGDKLFLYDNGNCVIRSSNGSNRHSGTYNIDGTKIVIKWDAGLTQQGWCRFTEGQITTVSVEGYTFTRRAVVKRRY